MARICIIDERCVTAAELDSTLDQLGKVAGREPNATLRQIVEEARAVSASVGKDDKARKKEKGSKDRIQSAPQAALPPVPYSCNPY